ncbi:UDP-N-acetyl-alpha-D-glucosamine C6 dehydratase [Bacteroides salyersiae]|uniref:polysaccharide biosynthesis protein n=1 Tax=Bacteroides salyersiae TaxID=291644 RepID=UPI001B8CF971|nr:nucleoside-diphosphate sugar epimerase/dehydratase [Bacteroides salyersiae]QUT74857.1 UDP-N-acetyl-alpha-D-glucosamine C6 dehydratase [Bacteroides salyersiae]
MNFLQKITNWYFSKKALPYWCVLVLDCLIVLFSGLVCRYIEIGGYALSNEFWPTVLGLIICLPLFAISFYIFHTYKVIIRFSSYVDLYRIAQANLLGSLLVGGVGENVLIPNLIFLDLKSAIILFGVSTFFLWIVRLAVKACFESLFTKDALPVVIYGTKAGGIALANSIKSVKKKLYILKAFISDGEEMQKAYLFGQKVYLNGKGIGERMKRLGVKVLLVSPLKSEKFRSNQVMVDEIIRAGIKIMMMPVAEEWDGKSRLTYQHLREVEIEDLLPREKIEVDMDAIGTMLADRHVLITGAAGSIGSEIVRQVASYKPAEMILVDQAETPMHNIRLMMIRQFPGVKNETIVVSITDKVHMEKIFSVHRPEYVFHAAAYKHVPMMEDNPAQAVRNNVNGTRVIADLAVKYGTKKFVMISTDKAVNPTNVMGCSKRICEIYCQALNKAIVEGKVKGDTQFVTTRFGNVLGSNGSVIPLFREQIKKGGPLTVTHPDIIRFFMLISEACKLVLEAGTMGKGGEIFVFDMGKPVKIVDLAKHMIILSGAKNIEIKFTGLRDGEKLFEEVLNQAEGAKPTHHPKIMIAQVRENDYEVVKHNEDELLQLSYTHDDMAIVKKMKEIVPEFKSRVSKYEMLDT